MEYINDKRIEDEFSNQKNSENNFKRKNFKLPLDTAINLETYTKENNMSQIEFINDLICMFFEEDNSEENLTEYNEGIINELEKINKDINSLKLTTNSIDSKMIVFYEILNSYFQAVDQEEIDLAFDYYNTKSKDIGKSESLGLIEEDIDIYKNQTIARKQDINE